jgi:hypothetical protein
MDKEKRKRRILRLFSWFWLGVIFTPTARANPDFGDRFGVVEGHHMVAYATLAGKVIR